MRLSILIILLFLSGCAARKVNISKTETTQKIDSISVEKKDSVSITENAIFIKENINEVEIVPIDNTQPIIINGKTYFNATVRFKKTNRQVIDTSKSIASHSQEKTVNLKTQINKQSYEKKIDKGFNYYYLLLIFLVLLLGFIYLKFKKII